MQGGCNVGGGVYGVVGVDAEGGEGVGEVVVGFGRGEGVGVWIAIGGAVGFGHDRDMGRGE